MSSSVIDEAFELLGEATKLEEDGSSSPQKKMEAATKYFEACYLMKRYVNRIPFDPSSNQNASKSSLANAKTRQLLMGKIDHYEKHASDLLRRINEENKPTPAALSSREISAGSASSGSGSATSWERNHHARVASWNQDGSIIPPAPHQPEFVHPAAFGGGGSGGGGGRGGVSNAAGDNGGRLRRNSSLVTEKAGQANARLAAALDYDEGGQTSEAIDEYMAAAALYLSAIKIVEEGTGLAGDLEKTLKRRIKSAMDRVDELKLSPSGGGGGGGHRPRKSQGSSGGPSMPSLPEAPAHDPSAVGSTQAPPAPPPPPPSMTSATEQTQTLTPWEIAVLKRSSLIASGLFMPWSDEEARTFKYRSASPWSDPEGLLKLSEKQSKRLHKWARPSEIASMRAAASRGGGTPHRPIMVRAITPYSIRQHLVTDCSFIASLCICSAFERRFKRRLVTSLIYPQDDRGYPMYNESGKYMVKLWLNGVARRVVVDDLFPVDKRGNLLCSHTDADSALGGGGVGGGGLELWVSIIEKAYMKLCGGYDFPGSNSGVDLFSLTGWIPERIFFPEDPAAVRDFETPTERAWERLHSANSYGDCLITASSSKELTTEQADAVGLVTGHAYAVLNVVKTKNGTRLLCMKNPWAHQGWKGKFSCHDIESWRDHVFCAEVGYNPSVARKHDDGIFWICWEDVLIYFRNLHLSWNPALFSSRTTVHSFWKSSLGPADDSFNVGENPQYTLILSEKAVKSQATVWILLSRHVTKQEQEGTEVTDYLTLHIHRINDAHERIWYPGGKSCVLTGAYTNNQHVLVRYDITGPEDKHLSLVLSQYQKSHDLGYTLSCFSTHSFKLGHPAKDPPYSTVVSSEWTSQTAGGPPGQKGFGSNPQWSMKVPGSGASVQLRCSAFRTYAINLMLIVVDSKGARVSSVHGAPIVETGDYRHGFVATKTCSLPGGFYTLVASTFNPGEMGGFRIELKSSVHLELTPIP